jgi:DNA replication and repair protein RecF
VAIESLRTAAFRNLADAETNTAARNVFLVGENGQGKTNFLEAIYFCCYASSFRGVKDAELARRGEKEFAAAASWGKAENQNSPELFARFRVSVKWEKQRKSIELDGKKIEDRKELLEVLPCVVFCHEDMDFVSGSQERRRWFFDQTQSLYDPLYLDDLRRYRRVLKSRNMILREAKFALRGYRESCSLLDVLDPQLAEYGSRLMEKRREAAERFSAVFGPLYEEVSDIAGIGVAYGSSWPAGSNRIDAAGCAQVVREKREADFTQGLTVSGPHRDRYHFMRAGSEFAASASTGQRRLLALLLRTAQARCFSGVTGKTPVLLLDDVLLELDGEKRRRFLSVMPEYEQAFFTFLPEEPHQGYRKSDTLVYHVAGGVITA